MKRLILFGLLTLAAPLYAQSGNPPQGTPDGELPPVATEVQSTLAGGNLERLLAARPVVNATLTIEQAAAMALHESPVLRGAAEEVEAALARLDAARAERKPFLSANTFLTGGSISNIVGSPPLAMMPGSLMNAPRGLFFDQNLSLMYPLYTGGRLSTLVRQAEALRGASQAELEGQRQEVALLARTAYREVQARRALVEVQRARLRENEEQLRIDRVRAEEGKIPPFFVLRQEAEAASTQQELTNAMRDVELSLLQLKTVLGVHPASNLDVAGVLEYQPSAAFIMRLAEPTAGSALTVNDVAASAGAASNTTLSTQSPSTQSPSTQSPSTQIPSPGLSTPDIPTPDALPAGDASFAGLSTDLRGLLRVAERGRPELREATARIIGTELEAAATDRAYRPQVNAFVMGDIMKMRGQGLTGGTTFGVAASIPLFTGGRRTAAVQIAQAEQRRLEHERERIALGVAQSVEAAYLYLGAAEQNIQTAQTALEAGQEDYRVARIRYEAGRSILVEVLDALAARTRAESNVVQALFAYNVARDQLLRAVGVLSLP